MNKKLDKVDRKEQERLSIVFLMNCSSNENFLKVRFKNYPINLVNIKEINETVQKEVR